jgi:cytochrome P450
MNAFILEVLRLYPPVFGTMGRVALEDVKVNDFVIKKGNNILIIFSGWFCNFCTLAQGCNPLYFERMDKFDYKKWLEPDKKNLDPFTLLPFSGGPRNCIG